MQAGSLDEDANQTGFAHFIDHFDILNIYSYSRILFLSPFFDRHSKY